MTSSFVAARGEISGVIVSGKVAPNSRDMFENLMEIPFGRMSSAPRRHLVALADRWRICSLLSECRGMGGILHSGGCCGSVVGWKSLPSKNSSRCGEHRMTSRREWIWASGSLWRRRVNEVRHPNLLFGQGVHLERTNFRRHGAWPEERRPITTNL